MNHDDLKEVFSKNLRDFMKMTNTKQIDFMNDLDLGSSTVSNWCNGVMIPRMDKLAELSDYMKVPVSRFFIDTRSNQLQEDAVFGNHIMTLTSTMLKEIEDSDYSDEAKEHLLTHFDTTVKLYRNLLRLLYFNEGNKSPMERNSLEIYDAGIKARTDDPFVSTLLLSNYCEEERFAFQNHLKSITEVKYSIDTKYK